MPLIFILCFKPIQDGPFRSSSQLIGAKTLAPNPKICNTYPAMMNLGIYILPKKDQINIDYVTHSMSSTDLRDFC